MQLCFCFNFQQQYITKMAKTLTKEKSMPERVLMFPFHVVYYGVKIPLKIVFNLSVILTCCCCCKEEAVDDVCTQWGCDSGL